jgi:hypothetical protein
MHDALLSIIVACPTELQILAISALRRLLERSEELCLYCLRSSEFPSVCSAWIDTSSDPEVVVELLRAIASVINHLSDISDLIPCADQFLRCLTINNDPQPRSIAGLTLCVSRCSEVGDYLAEKHCFGVMAALAASADPIRIVVLDFVGTLLRVGSLEARAALVDHFDWREWAKIKENDVVAVWADIVIYGGTLMAVVEYKGIGNWNSSKLRRFGRESRSAS